MNGKFIRACMKRWRRTEKRVMASTACDKCCEWSKFWPSVQEEKMVPNDVPKGHLVVYVGEYKRRFVINITLLKHPLFKALLDQAQEAYDFTADSKLCIPCDESIFLSVIQCAKSPRSSRIQRCL